MAAFYAFIVWGNAILWPSIQIAPQSRDGISPTLLDTTQTYLGTIDHVQRIGDRHTDYIVRLHDDDTASRLVSLSIARRPSDDILKPGDDIGFRTRFKLPHASRYPHAFRYDEWLKSQGVSLTAYCNAEDIVPLGKSQQPTISEYALRLRATLLDSYAEHLPDSTSYRLIAALTLGDRSNLTPRLRQQFADSGASHILALSGLHLSIIYMVYAFLVLGPARRRGLGWQYTLAAALGIALTWTFVLIAGAPLSLVRAAAMLTVMTILQLVGATYHEIDRFAIAILAILAVSPRALFDVSFQMSSASVAGIILIAPLIPRWERDKFYPHGRLYNHLQPIGAWMWDVVRISLSAWLAVLGITARTFHDIPLLGFATSILTIPLTTAILLLAVAFLLLTPLRSLIGIFMTYLARGLELVTHTAQNLPATGFSWYATDFGVATYYIALAVFCQVISRQGRSMRHRRRPWLVAFATIVLCGSATEAYLQRPGRLNGQYFCYDIYGTPALHVIASPDSSLIITTDTLKARRASTQVSHNFWQRYDLTVPEIRSTSSQAATAYWTFADGILNFAGKTLVVADRTLSTRLGYDPVAERCVHTDWLVLCRGCQTPVTNLLQIFNPKQLILDASLGQYKRQEAIRATSAHHIPVHDLREDYIKGCTNR